MNKFFIFISILGFIAVLVFLITEITTENCSLMKHIKYLQGRNQYDYLPKNIARKHKITIEKADAFIRKEYKDSITSESQNFNLEVYLKHLEIGIIPYLQEDDSLTKPEVLLLIQDIVNYLNKCDKII